MQRYTYTRQKSKSGKTLLTHTIYPKIPPRISDLYIMTKDGDRLDLLATTYYGNASAWWIIAQANSITGGTLYVDPGKQLRIPTEISTIIDDLDKINNEE